MNEFLPTSHIHHSPQNDKRKPVVVLGCSRPVLLLLNKTKIIKNCLTIKKNLMLKMFNKWDA